MTICYLDVDGKRFANAIYTGDVPPVTYGLNGGMVVSAQDDIMALITQTGVTRWTPFYNQGSFIDWDLYWYAYGG